MKVAVVGSRDCGELKTRRILEKLPSGCSLIISGGAMGVDSFAELAAKEQNIPFCKLEPDYKKYGKSAPVMRNIQIVEQADLVLAFWDYQSRGTAHTIAECIKRNVPVQIYDLTE